MKIVIPDSATIVQDDLDWSALAPFGEVTVYPRTPQHEAAARIGDADAVLTTKIQMSAEVIAACPRLRYIGVLATGYNNIDLDAAAARGITVSNIPAYSTAAVAQHIFALLLELTNRVGAHSAAVADGKWTESPDFCFVNGTLTELAGKTMTIVGLGQIGQAAARIALAFGMQVCAVVRRPEAAPRIDGVRIVSDLCDGLRAADVVALCCPLTPATENMLCARTLGCLRRGALVINTARGPLVNEADMAAALRSGAVGGFAADVISAEPMHPDNPLRTAPHCILTPHIAWAAHETRARLIEIAAANLAGFLNGQPQNIVQTQYHG